MVPKPTRRSAVIQLEYGVPLLSTVGGVRVGNDSVVASSFESVKVISAYKMELHPLCPDGANYKISFFGNKQDTCPLFKAEPILVSSWWTPNIFLGVLHDTIKGKKNIVLYEESNTLFDGAGSTYIAINNMVNTFFSLDQQPLENRLLQSGSFFVADGGTYLSPTKQKE